jgi:hypothetical protein
MTEAKAAQPVPGASPHWLFDPGFYAAQYARIYSRTFDPSVDGDAYQHFLRLGQKDGLSGHWLFDPAVYAALAPYDILCRIRRVGPFTTLLSHLRAGTPEPVCSNAFDPTWYLARYPKVRDEIEAGHWICALHHYLANPEPERFDPSPRFSNSGYVKLHPDVASAIAEGGFRNGHDHFLRHGRSEGRRFVPATSHSDGVSRDINVSVRFPLQVQTFDNLIFLPCARDTASPTGYSFGVFGPDGEPSHEFSHPWCRMRSHEGRPVAQDSRQFIYGGILMNHFGHVVRDALATLWCLREHPDLPVLWHWIDLPVPHNVWPGWMQQLWQIIGLDKHEHRRIVAPICVGRVMLPESGLLAPTLLHEAQADALAVLPGDPPQPGLRVWLSRQGLPRQFGSVRREDEVEAILAGHGWTILRPQDRSVAEQAGVFTAADVVAGFMSSAFHAVLLAKAPAARLVLVIRPGIDRSFYDAAAQARGLDQAYVLPDLAPHVRPNGWTHFALTDPEKLAADILTAAGL